MRLSKLGATSKAVEEKMKSWPNIWNAFQSATEELHIEIFEQIKEKTKGAVSTIAELTRKFSEWINKTEIAKKALDAFLHGLGFNLPSTDEFTDFLDNLKIDDFLSVAQNLGKTLRNISESIVTFFTTVKTPLLFLIENLGTFATISFWGWILGSGMRIASIALQMANGIGRLTTVLTGLAGAGAALASLTGAGLGVLAGGGIMYAIHRYSEHTIEQQKLEAEKKKAEAEMKRADEELRATIDDFVSCSLDGRLWLFKKTKTGTNLVLAVLRWDAENNKLIFAQSRIIRNSQFLARGLDWILTDIAIAFAQDEAPYMYYYQLNFQTM